jgi:hypothetical protein
VRGINTVFRLVGSDHKIAAEACAFGAYGEAGWSLGTCANGSAERVARECAAGARRVRPRPLSDPFAAIDRSAVYDCYVTFLHDDVVVARGLPPSSPRGDVQMIQFTGSEALCVAHKLAKSPGSPNAFVEKTLALPATTRAWNTVVRLVAKHGLEG